MAQKMGGKNVWPVEKCVGKMYGPWKKVRENVWPVEKSEEKCMAREC